MKAVNTMLKNDEVDYCTKCTVKPIAKEHMCEECYGEEEMKEITDEKRPVCSCGNKMDIVEFNGYYDEFNYFECSKCELDADDYKSDKEHYGQYVF